MNKLTNNFELVYDSSKFLDCDEFENEDECDLLAEMEWDDFVAENRDYLLKRYTITGSLGLWSGSKRIEPVIDTLRNLINKCNGRDIEWIKIFSDNKGTFKINAYHHDGTNQFLLKPCKN
jgi:hypothetical protein